MTVRPIFQRTPSVLDVPLDPVPPYEEFPAGPSSWQIVNHHGDGTFLLPVAPREETANPESKVLSEDDIVIAVMGVTGAGKSTFVSTLTHETVTIGHDLKACTTEPGIYNYVYKGRLIRLVDTPGFDDTNRSDTDILQDVAFFLSALHARNIRLAAIVYLHRIIDPRMTGTAMKNLQLLQNLCGNEGLQKVVLVSTMWNLLTDERNGGSENGIKIGEEREKMLKDKFWDQMITRGSVVVRHYGDKVSGDRILEGILESRKPDVVLDIQRELIDDKLALPQTAAGQFLQQNLLQARKQFEREIRECEQELAEAKQAKDQELVQELEKQQREVVQQLGVCNSKTAELNVDFRTMATGAENWAQNPNNQWQKKHSEDIRLIEQNLAEMQDSMERQEREHRENIARLRKSERSKAADSVKSIMQQKQMFEEQNQDLRMRIAREEQIMLEKDVELRRYRLKKDGAGIFGKLFDSLLSLLDESEDNEKSHFEYRGAEDFHGGSRHYHQQIQEREHHF